MRDRRQVLMFLFVLATRQLFPQPVAGAEQLSFTKDIDLQSPRYYPAGFQARFFDGGNRSVRLEDTKLYREKSVKKISVYNSERHLMYFFELDSTAAVLRSGYPVGAYLAISHVEKKGGVYIYSMTYCDPVKISLVSSDTTYRTSVTYRNGDTVITFQRNRIVSYKVGHLINERNTYYNEHYSDWPAEGYTNYYAGLPLIVNTNGKKSRAARRKQQPRKNFAVNYTADSIYYCGEKSYDEPLYAYRNSAGEMLDCQIPGDHRFRRELNTNQNNYTTEGESFAEPVVMHEAMFCGNALYAARQRAMESSFYRLSFTYNERGLYDSCYTLYYAPDTSRMARDKYYKSRTDTAEKVILFNDGVDPGPRRSIPDKALTYFIRYEYF